MDERKQVVQRLLKVAGTTYAAEAGVTISDKPMPLFQLLVLCMLASKPIDATIAMRAGHELFSDGLRTPKAVLDSDRRTMIDAFGRAHYVRYDESSATRLTEIAQRVCGRVLRRPPRNRSPQCRRHQRCEANAHGDSRESATPAPTSTCAKSKTSGLGCDRISTNAPPEPPRRWACPPTRQSWVRSPRAPMPAWPPLWCGHRSMTMCATVLPVLLSTAQQKGAVIMANSSTFVIIGGRLGGAKAAEALREKGFDGHINFVCRGGAPTLRAASAVERVSCGQEIAR